MSNDNNFFDINNYTETKNPILSSIFQELQNSTELGKLSVDVKGLQDRHSEKYDRFYNSLTEEQKDLMRDVYLNIGDENTQAETECFNIGFKLCARLMMEVFS